MAWKKPKIVSRIQKAAQTGANKAGDALRNIPAPKAPTGPILPYLTQVLPNTVGNLGRGVDKVLTGDAVSGLKDIGQNVADLTRHTVNGAIINPITQAMGPENTPAQAKPQPVAKPMPMAPVTPAAPTVPAKPQQRTGLLKRWFG